MERTNKELLIARIISGTIRLKFNDKIFIVTRPTHNEIYESELIYQEAIEENTREGLYDEDELMDFLLDNNFWNDNKERLLKKLPKEIEEFKLSLFKATFKSNERKVIRNAIKTAKDKLNNLFIERHSYDNYSINGAATLVKSRYLMSVAVRNLDGTKVFGDFWNCDADLLDKIIGEYNLNRISDSQFREIARNDPWKTIWYCRKAENLLFNKPSIEYTEEQKGLVGWSTMYESIMEHPECPTEEIIEDDDMLDGWLIDQRRKREDRNKQNPDSIVQNDQIRNCQEVFIPVDTLEDAKKIDELNNPTAKRIKQQRASALKKKGELREDEMPDTKQEIVMELNRMSFEK